MEHEKKFLRVKGKALEPLIVGNKTFLSFVDYTLTASDLEKAKKDLGETEDGKETCLKTLKEKLSREEIKYRMDDEYLLRYIRFSKYRVDKAFKCINNLYAYRTKYPEVFYTPSKLEYILNTGVMMCLPYKDEKKNPIYIVKFEKWDTGTFSLFEFLAVVFIIWDLWSVNPHNQINGLKLMFDGKGINTSQGTEIIRHVKFFMPLMQELYPWRISNLLFFNFNLFARMVLKIVTPFLKKKMFEKITVLGSDVDELHEHINPEILPKEYGGNLEKNEINMTTYVLDNMDYLQYERSFG